MSEPTFQELEDAYNAACQGTDGPEVYMGPVPAVTLEGIEIPKGQVALLVRRKPGETLSAWADRCGVLYNVVESPSPEINQPGDALKP